MDRETRIMMLDTRARLAIIRAKLLMMDYEKDPDPENWRTINGSKVHLTNGRIDGGAGGKFSGNAWTGKKSHGHNSFFPQGEQRNKKSQNNTSSREGRSDIIKEKQKSSSNAGAPHSEYKKNIQKIKSSLHGIESKYKASDHEWGTIINTRGDVVNVTEGKAHSVEPPAELLKDCIFTHNHPGGGCFTTKDIESMINQGVLELRAFTPQGLHFSLRRKEGVTPDKRILAGYKQATHISKAIAATRADVRAGHIRKEDETYTMYEKYRRKLAMKWLKENADKYGFVFSYGVI